MKVSSQKLPSVFSLQWFSLVLDMPAIRNYSFKTTIKQPNFISGDFKQMNETTDKVQ
jgi:hypothetical protein